MSDLLGTVTCPTGDLLLIDFGLLHLWSHDRTPHVADGVLQPHVQAGWNGARDVEIVGPDARAVARALDLAFVKGRFGFDLDDGAAVSAKVAEVCAAQGWQAEVREVARMPHLTRVTSLLDDDPEGTEFSFPGGWGTAVRGLPTDRAMEVRGERMPTDGPDQGRWHSVWVQVSDAAPASTVEIGYVLVDEARLMFADPVALGDYLVDASHDGLADLVLWGRDGEAVAAAVGAPRSGESEWGWSDIDSAAAEHHLTALDAERARGARFAHDLRPHNDHFRLLAQARSTPTESGTLDLDAGTVTGFFTTWGDGAFPVFRDLAADGSLCRVRVELGAPEIVARTRRFERLWFGDLSLLAIASTRITRDGLPVGWLQRGEPRDERDSGWSLYGGDETQEYCDDPAHLEAVPLRELLRLDPTFESVIDAAAPCGFERDGDGWRDISHELD